MINSKIREAAEELGLECDFSKALKTKTTNQYIDDVYKILDHCCTNGYLGRVEAGRVLMKLKHKATETQIFYISGAHHCSYYSELQASIVQCIEASGCWVSSALMTDCEQYSRFPYNKAFALIAIGEIKKEILSEFKNWHVPVILVDNRISECHYSAVNSNNYESVNEVMQKLVSLGHTKTAFWCAYGMQSDYVINQRHLGYLNAYTQAGYHLNSPILNLKFKKTHTADLNEDECLDLELLTK